MTPTAAIFLISFLSKAFPADWFVFVLSLIPFSSVAFGRTLSLCPSSVAAYSGIGTHLASYRMVDGSLLAFLLPCTTLIREKGGRRNTQC